MLQSAPVTLQCKLVQGPLASVTDILEIIPNFLGKNTLDSYLYQCRKKIPVTEQSKIWPFFIVSKNFRL